MFVSTQREYRLVVPGEAVSFRSRKRAPAYKAKVRKIARKLFRAPLRSQVEVRIDYFHPRRRRCDMDNISKGVLDALNKIAYLDDVRARLQSSEAHYLGEPIRLLEGPADLVKPLRNYDEYLFIRIREI